MINVAYNVKEYLYRWHDGPCIYNAIFNHWNVAISRKLEFNSRLCGLLKIVCPEICFDFLIDWGLVMP